MLKRMSFVLALIGAAFSLQANAQSTLPPGAIPVQGAQSNTAGGATTLISSPGGNYRIRVMQLECGNTSGTTVTVQLDDGASSIFIVPAGGGTNVNMGWSPLVVPLGQPLTFAPSAAETTIYCDAQGYYAP